MAIGVHHHHHIHHHLYYLHHLGFILIWLILIVGSVSTEEECLKKKIWCYNCTTENNPKCGDPFNVSLVREEKDVPLKHCEGCCIKIVKKKDTPQQSITRTCTGEIQINLFMVDHVCMEESDGKGHMCFCESDACNLGSTISPLNSSLLGTITLIVVLTLTSKLTNYPGFN